MRRSRDTRDSNKRGRVFLREYFSVASIRRHSKTDTMPYLYSGISNEKSIGWVLLPLSLFNEELVPPRSIRVKSWGIAETTRFN